MDTDFDSAVQRAWQYWERSDYWKMLRETDRALRLSPTPNFRAHELLVLSLYHLRRMQDAVVAAETVLDLFGPDPWAFFYRAAALRKLKRLEEAMDDCDAALEIDPNYSSARNLRKLVLHELHRSDEAIDRLERSFEADLDRQYRQTDRCEPPGCLEHSADSLGETEADGMQDDWPTHFTRGDALFRSDDMLGARREFERALELDPDSDLMLWRLGHVAEELDDPERALELYRTAAALCPDVSYYEMDIARVLEQMGSLEDALAYADRAASLDPMWSEPPLLRSRILARFERHDESLSAVVEALQLDPRNVGARVRHYSALRDLDRFDEALETLDALLDTGFETDWLRTDRSEILLELGRAEEAVMAADLALLLDPTSPEARIARGRALVDCDRVTDALDNIDVLLQTMDRADHHMEKAFILILLGRESAIDSCRAAIRRDPGSRVFRMALIDTLEMFGRFEDVLSEIDALTAPDPLAPDLLTPAPLDSSTLQQQAHALTMLARYDEAETSFRLALQIDENSTAAWTSYASMLYATGRAEEAMEILGRGIEANPAAADLHACVGELLIEQGDLEGAARQIRHALTLDSSDHQAITAQLELYLRTYRFDEGIRLARSAREQHPNSTTVLVIEAKFHRIMCDHAAAEEALERALQIDPSDDEAREMLGEIRGG